MALASAHVSPGQVLLKLLTRGLSIEQKRGGFHQRDAALLYP